ncbi:MAG: protein-disulfide reductase DsbD domain-containing protein [Akkermansiaceae bacterium]
MKFLITTLAFLFTCLLQAKGTHATATWVLESAEIKKGAPLRTVIKMKINDGWHTYWENPGEGGLPLSIDATLPKNWTLGKIQYPAPKRFKTGELPGFGYEKEVDFPLTIHPPANFIGKLPVISATVSWLTCDDESCVPGDAELSSTTATTDVEIIQASYAAVPKKIEKANLKLSSSEGLITLRLTLPVDSKVDPTQLEGFPATENIIDPAAKLKFEKATDSKQAWIATAPVSEYFSKLPKAFKLVLAKKGGTSYAIFSN